MTDGTWALFFSFPVMFLGLPFFSYQLIMYLFSLALLGILYWEDFSSSWTVTLLEMEF